MSDNIIAEEGINMDNSIHDVPTESQKGSNLPSSDSDGGDDSSLMKCFLELEKKRKATEDPPIPVVNTNRFIQTPHESKSRRVRCPFPVTNCTTKARMVLSVSKGMVSDTSSINSSIQKLVSDQDITSLSSNSLNIHMEVEISLTLSFPNNEFTINQEM